jgi:succinate-semialdehyde dehydrogenase
VAAVRDLKIGNQEAEETFIGPMARYDLRDEMNGQVQATIDGGAAVLLGGNKIDGPGSPRNGVVRPGNLRPRRLPNYRK